MSAGRVTFYPHDLVELALRAEDGRQLFHGGERFLHVDLLYPLGLKIDLWDTFTVQKGTFQRKSCDFAHHRSIQLLGSWNRQ